MTSPYVSCNHAGYIIISEKFCCAKLPVYHTHHGLLFFIDETRRRITPLNIPLSYEIILAINNRDIHIVLDKSDTYEEYETASRAHFPYIYINGVKVINNTLDDDDFDKWSLPVIWYSEATVDILPKHIYSSKINNNTSNSKTFIENIWENINDKLDNVYDIIKNNIPWNINNQTSQVTINMNEP